MESESTKDTDSARLTEEIGNRLKNIELSGLENGVVELEVDDIKTSAEECDRSLFGKIIGDRKANLLGIRRTMGSIWKVKHPVKVRELSYNFFQFIFGSQEDKKKVAAGVNWVFDNQYLVLLEWMEGLSAEHKGFSELNLWVQASNIPIHWMSAQVGLKLGRLFKKVKNVVVIKAGGRRGSFIRLLVTVDLSEPLLRCTNLKFQNQQVLVVFQYERLVSLCYYCGRVGHLDRTCEKRLSDIGIGCLKEGQYGDWMKAVERGRSAKSSQFSSPPVTQAASFVSPTVNGHQASSSKDNFELAQIEKAAESDKLFTEGKIISEDNNKHQPMGLQQSDSKGFNEVNLEPLDLELLLDVGIYDTLKRNRGGPVECLKGDNVENDTGKGKKKLKQTASNLVVASVDWPQSDK